MRPATCKHTRACLAHRESFDCSLAATEPVPSRRPSLTPRCPAGLISAMKDVPVHPTVCRPGLAPWAKITQRLFLSNGPVFVRMCVCVCVRTCVLSVFTGVSACTEGEEGKDDDSNFLKLLVMRVESATLITNSRIPLQNREEMERGIIAPGVVNYHLMDLIDRTDKSMEKQNHPVDV